MATPTRNILFKFLGDQKSLEKATRATTGNLGKITKSSAGANTSLGILKEGAKKLGAVLAVGALFKGLKSAVLRAQEMDSQYAITARIIETTGGAAKVTGEDIKAMSREMALTTGIDKSVATEAANILLTFKELRNEVGLGNDVFARAHKLTGDMAVVFKGSASDAAKTLGKALNAPIEGLTALRRVGVTFTEQQKEQIKTLVKSGDVLGAQKIILEELESQVGGTAAASADATKIMAAAYQEVAEKLGEKLLPAMVAVAEQSVLMLDASEGWGRSLEAGGRGIDKFVQRISGFASLGFADLWTDADEAMFEFAKTAEFANQRIEEGADATQTAGNWMAHLATKGALTRDTLQRVAEQMGLTNQEMVDAAIFAIENADALGLTAAQVEILRGTYIGLNPLLESGAALTGHYADSLLDAADRATGAADATQDAADAVAGLADEHRKLVDPVFKAQKAQEAFDKVLLQVTEDGIVTRAELDKLTKANLDLAAANEQVTPENMEAYGAAVEETRKSVVGDAKLMEDALAGIGTKQSLEAFLGLVQRLETLAESPIEIDLSGLNIASRADVEQAVTRLLLSMRRRGDLVNIPI